VEDYKMLQLDEKKVSEPTGMPARRCSQEEISVKEAIERAAAALIQLLNGKWIEATKEAIEAADGRKNKLDPICKSASCLYVAYAGERVLYVGETSKSIKRRFIVDGSGSHKEDCSIWYAQMTHVRYVSFGTAELPEKHRKLFEQALSIELKPEFYGKRQ
jgi:hypothetical protein